MNCAEVGVWLHLSIDGRLSADRLAQLESHLETCSNCRREREALESLRATLSVRELVPEPEHLSRQIMARVAAYEAQRAVQPTRVVLVRDAALRVGLVLALIVLVVEIIQPSLWTSLASEANHSAPQLIQALTAPGPNSVAWSIWALGAVAALVVAMRIMRSDAYASWLRSVTDRLPQLW
ncbi:MAG TPA: zf-HC2 domain-containing protein [Ktedonobacterales bacterium]|nr:zf-HC2 domain-containing protein [Ktedonobacterales bacterium]